MSDKPLIKNRFRGFLPIVIDIETGGTNPQTDAVLELAASVIKMDGDGQLFYTAPLSLHVAPFEGANIDREALEFTGIIPDHPFRFAISEAEALEKLFAVVNAEIQETSCQRAVLVGHNAWFDLHFLQQMVKRVKVTNPFHKFTSFDTATLSALAFGQTVLARACKKANIHFDKAEAHSAAYDTEKTAELFCHIMNRGLAS